jgi:drug/metabolite transporter (DMT)-like permease
MNADARYFAGIACVLGYIAIASSQSVALSSWLATSNVFLVAGLSFVLVVLLFAGIAISTSGTAPYQVILRHRRLLLALNIAGTVNWLFYFLAVKYLPPAVAVTLTQGIGPLSMSTYKLLRREPVSRVTIRCHVLILVAAVVMCGHVIDQRISNASYGRLDIAMAIVIAVVCSVSITTTLVLSRTFAAARVPASVVLSIRFPMLIAVCLLALPTQHHIQFDGRTLAVVAAVGLIGVGGGAYLLQRGVELAPALAVSTCLAVSPVVVFAIGVFDSAAGSDPAIFALVSLVVIVSVISIVYDGSRLRRTTAALAPVASEAPHDGG